MKVGLSVRNILMIVALTAAWCALWRTLSFANVASGLVFASLMTFAGLGTEGKGSIRPVALAQLGWFVLRDLTLSTISVAYEVITPNDNTDEAVIGVELPAEANDHLLLLTLMITLTPGTAVIDSDVDESVIYVHALYGQQRDEVVEGVLRLADLACRALPVPASSATSEVSP